MISEILALLALAATTIVLVFTLSMFRDWVKNKVGSYRNRQIITGLVRERLANSDYKIIPFLYDTKEKAVIEKEVIQTPLIDPELEEKIEDNVLIEPISTRG